MAEPEKPPEPTAEDLLNVLTEVSAYRGKLPPLPKHPGMEFHEWSFTMKNPFYAKYRAQTPRVEKEAKP